MKLVTCTLALLLAAGAASAHPGHDPALSGAAHWVFSPAHGLGLLALAGGLALSALRPRRG
ncbi:hypothetical protein KM176_10095 [Pseudooceanicola sp. CBS1P-1]|uniref:Uncharacterized protein n=1 Tax=Pseudooceanicola albus TaxID=2692189 RepID=A0A6L7G6I8_9RHOB|nr:MULTISPECIES: hypothetical protein [Pseudooceanicola]MBT9384210.1 hypothetical protein [Pseudooceanicola endophyticus]MXN19691.1 hypothetical protein [Pseudooceanicola albus]